MGDPVEHHRGDRAHAFGAFGLGFPIERERQAAGVVAAALGRRGGRRGQASQPEAASGRALQQDRFMGMMTGHDGGLYGAAQSSVAAPRSVVS